MAKFAFLLVSVAALAAAFPANYNTTTSTGASVIARGLNSTNTHFVVARGTNSTNAPVVVARGLNTTDVESKRNVMDAWRSTHLSRRHANSTQARVPSKKVARSHNTTADAIASASLSRRTLPVFGKKTATNSTVEARGVVVECHDAKNSTRSPSSHDMATAMLSARNGTTATPNLKNTRGPYVTPQDRHVYRVTPSTSRNSTAKGKLIPTILRESQELRLTSFLASIVNSRKATPMRS